MSADLQKQLAEMLRKLVDVSADATKWAGQQIPPLVQEKIAFGRAWETVLFLLLLIGVGLLVKCVLLCYRQESKVKDRYNDNPGWIIGGMFSGVGAVILSIFACVQLEAMLMVWFAPRLYIVEWLRTFLKG